MANQFEHLQLPKTEIQLTRRSPKGFSGSKRANRSSHGGQLLNQVSGILDRLPKQYTPFGINPKLIFKIKLAEKFNLTDDQITKSGLNLLAKESKKQNAIVVFPSDNELAVFKERLESYSGIREDSPEYAYLDAIEEIVPLEPVDRIGLLLQLEPLEPQVLAALDLELWHTGDTDEMRNYIDNLDKFLKDWSEYPGMEVTDKYIGEYICLVRIKVIQEIVEILLEEDDVKEIDRRPKPAFESPREINIPLSDFPEIESPPDTNCGVLVIDSGVQGGHPLIAKTLGDKEVFHDQKHQFITGDANDGDTLTGGHGTAVAGIAIYGDVAQSLNNKLFQPQVWLFSARVTNQNNEYDPDLLLENQLEQAVNYFVNHYSNCKVINISLGDDRLIYRDGQKQFRLAAKIDEIAYKLQHKNILFVVSAGNHYYQAESRELLRQNYPNYLLNEEARIIEPATAALALTVGSLSLGTGSCDYPEDASRNAITKTEGYPSSFTRTGFGVDGMIKPELVDFGGDLIIDRNKVIDKDIGTTILTLNKNFLGSSLFKGFCGTSFSAPRVSNLAAQLFTKFPDATPNLIRALIANSAQLPTEIPDQFNFTKKNDKADNKIKPLQIYGYGQPNYDVAAYSTDNYVVLQEEGSIPVGEFTIYEIPPLPDEFLNTKGDKKISVTLAFDPPTRHTRGDSYLGVTMEFKLFKNIDAENLKKAFFKANKSENGNPEDSIEIPLSNLKKQFRNSIDVDLFPGSNLRKKGTLQKGQITITSNTWKYDRNPMYVFVACNRKWAREGEVDSQRYALVVSISHSNTEVNLYNQLQTQIQNRVTPRVRIR